MNINLKKGFNEVENGSNEDKLVKIMLLGDPTCTISMGSNVIKVSGDEDDHHELGTPGEVVGSLKHSDGVQELYLVKFKDNEHLTAIAGVKLMKI